ncbi:hypothetical protein GCM10010505_77170 [Kitasatospora aburaviensis]
MLVMPRRWRSSTDRPVTRSCSGILTALMPRDRPRVPTVMHRDRAARPERRAAGRRHREMATRAAGMALKRMVSIMPPASSR